MGSPHLFHLFNSQLQTTCEGGRRIDVTADQLPALSGMALSLLELNPAGFREPHWHPNAHELSYCLEGTGLMTIFSPGAGHDTFTIQPGDIAFVPMGYLHHVENTGKTPLKMALCFNHQDPEDIDLSSGVGVMPAHIMGDTFSLPASFFTELKASVKSAFIVQRETPAVPPYPMTTGRFRMGLEASHPQVKTAGGWVKMSNGFLLPTLEGLSIYAVQLERGGAREPHWHPNAHELNYLVSGSALITILSPGGKVETFEMKAGDLSFLPKGYLHHIENTGNEPAHFAIFFNHVSPSDIGFSGCLGAYSNEVLAAVFKVPVSYFDNLPKYQQDLFVVGGG